MVVVVYVSVIEQQLHLGYGLKISEIHMASLVGMSCALLNWDPSCLHISLPLSLSLYLPLSHAPLFPCALSQ